MEWWLSLCFFFGGLAILLLIGLPVAYVTGLYGMFVAMRALGMLYHHHDLELNWFGEASRFAVPAR